MLLIKKSPILANYYIFSGWLSYLHASGSYNPVQQYPMANQTNWIRQTEGHEGKASSSLDSWPDPVTHLVSPLQIYLMFTRTIPVSSCLLSGHSFFPLPRRFPFSLCNLCFLASCFSFNASLSHPTFLFLPSSFNSSPCERPGFRRSMRAGLH